MRISLTLLLMLAAVEVLAETYIVPVWGRDLRGADGVYYSSIEFTNTSAHPVQITVERVFPALTGSCSTCGGPPALVEKLMPHFKRIIGTPGVSLPVGDMTLGAVVLRSDLPLEVGSIAFRSPNLKTSSEVVEIARDWIGAGKKAIVYDALSLTAPSNLFVVNPNLHSILVDYWSGGSETRSLVLAPESTAVVAIPARFACPTGCGSGTIPLGQAFNLHLRADGEYLAAVSTKAAELPPIVRVSKPAE